MNIDQILERARPVMPVLVIDDASKAIAMADALADGGIEVLEITLRTASALEAIEAIRQARPDLIVGAGTVVSAAQMQALADAGGQFAVSPGFSPQLTRAAHEASMPYLPGVVTASEIQQATECGLGALKFFPAAAAGGSTLLRNFAGVFPEVVFCPTGGIRLETMNDYLALNNVRCIGGSWIAPRQAIADEKWQQISANARAAISAAQS
ncbi:MAG: bifunctional 4-hydroxy-2-oxoglutarate aldolase/2-dehydro-3-deoxy-phosphogluconate aldolase [Gammaproteobacteria bacterium]|nr:bifunctional 4-hydroxy-2-oxoglutarate aldolase/2-dehydro-3-deoxy-phosphogluconate aldolase [Gammaproteobacteria bacterium]